MPSISSASMPTNFLVNVSSMIGQLSLDRTESSFAQSMRNLATGLRIHSGKDDPIGFIASTAMQTDIVSTKQAITNCERANSVISTMDASLNQLNLLINDLRGLVTQAANTGAENAVTLDALQLEADAILDSIDRIAATTQFQNQKLLDGSLNFTTYAVPNNKLSLVTVNQANFLGRTEKDIDVQVIQQPTQGQLYYPFGSLAKDVILDIGGSQGYKTFQFSTGATVEQIATEINTFSDSTGIAAKVFSQSQPGTIGITSHGLNNDIIVSASQTGMAAGNIVIRYTVPEHGNNELALDVTPSVGNEPMQINVLLQTEDWVNSVFHYNGKQDGVSNNEFTITAKNAGAGLNNVQFVINNVWGTETPVGVEENWTSSPQVMTLNVRYDENDPGSAQNTKAADVERWFRESAMLNRYFTFQRAPDSDGSGPMVPSSPIELQTKGVDGGSVVTTAEQIVHLLNTSPLLKAADNTGLVSATIPSWATGTGVVTPFEQYAYYGTPGENNYLQFLAPKDAPSIRFESTPNTPLSIDNTTYQPVLGRAQTQIQGLDPGTSFTVRSLEYGPQYDNVAVILRDATEEGIVFNAELNALIFSVDFTGRAATPSRGPFSMNDLQQLLAADPLVKSKFEIIPTTPFEPGTPPTFASGDYLGINSLIGTLSGGLIDPGYVTIHLETDLNGNIKTTANDLVKFFNYPPTENAQKLLDKLGISVAIIDPTNLNTPICTIGESAYGNGLLRATYNPFDCVDTSNMYPDVIFTSSGAGLLQDYPTATTYAINGLHASFSVTATKEGSEYNNTRIQMVSDQAGPSVMYDRLSKTLTIGLNPLESATANDIIALINGDPATKEIFVASNAPYSAGSGLLTLGDGGILTGGIKQSVSVAEGNVISGNGVNAMFAVTAQYADPQYADTEILVVSTENEASVHYDPQSKQLTISVNPQHPLSALQVVDLINATPDIRNIFSASIPPFLPGTTIQPTGEDLVMFGDKGALRISDHSVRYGAPMIGGSDQTGLGLTFYAVEYGSKEFVSVIPSLGSDFYMLNQYNDYAERSYGTDAVAKINGELAVTSGRKVSILTSDLDIDLWLDPSVKSGDVFGFRITGGGMLMQLGPDPISAHQARIGIGSIKVADLGGLSGTLSQLRRGAPADLLTDTNTAFRIVEEVTGIVSSLRGRLGAFQKNQVLMTMQNLIDTNEIEISAQSDIKDSDFATESSSLMRQQILLQANISVLQYPSQNARLLLELLRQ